ncbi:MAG: DUF58 domain-containing protein [Betaproteobacteria bacterium]|nr:DUF58 domain-containing protein [Betaproteobacteria bacterium]
MRATGTLLRLLVVWFVIGLAAGVWPALTRVWWFVGVLLVLLGTADVLAARRQGTIDVTRRASTFPVGVWSEVALSFTYLGMRAVTLEVFDHHPTAMEGRGMPVILKIPGHGVAQARYGVCPTERGEHCFGQTELLIVSPLRLWKRRVVSGAAQTVRVYPNFAAVAKYALFATDNRLSMLGVHRRPRRGEGLEFHQLREYRAGDMLRQIDWKATSRLKKLVSREYQDERDQQVFFLIDCGRRMHAKDGPLSHFDHALNAILLLAYVALRQGDAVGFMTFAEETRYLAPKKGAAAINTILEAIYDVKAGNCTPDYAKAATALMTRLKKRALIVLVTNLRDEDSDELKPALRLLQRRHMVLLASLQEQILNEVLNRPVDDLDDALRLCATHLYLATRRKMHETVVSRGVLCVDVEPEVLPITLVNGYLDIKRSGLL